MEHTTTKSSVKSKKEISPIRKLTSELDVEVRKVEAEKFKAEKLAKSIGISNERIRVISLEISKCLVTMPTLS